MPQAVIGPAIGLGSAALGAGSGKKASKKQQKLAEQQMQQLQPLINAIISATGTGLQEGQTQIGRGEKLAQQSNPYFLSGLKGLEGDTFDLQNFYRPLATGNRSAIDAFLSPERRAINQGYQSVQNQIARFAPRGGGRVAAGVNADVNRQGQLSDLVFNARKTGAEGLGQVGSLFSNLAGQGLSGVSQGFSGIGQGLGAISGAGSGAGNLFQMLSNSQNNAANLAGSSGANITALGKDLSKFLAGIFGGSAKQDKGIGTYIPGGYIPN